MLFAVVGVASERRKSQRNMNMFEIQGHRTRSRLAPLGIDSYTQSIGFAAAKADL